MKLKFKRWKEDKWLSKEGSLIVYDKAEHFILFFLVIIVGYVFLPMIEMKAWTGLWILMGFGYELLWDGPKTGFSLKDFIADLAGIASAHLFIGVFV